MNEFSMVSSDELKQIEGGGLLGDIVSACIAIGKALVRSSGRSSRHVPLLSGGEGRSSGPWSTNCSKTTGGQRRARDESLNLGGAGSPAFKVSAETNEQGK